jgi:hypothetical protein
VLFTDVGRDAVLEYIPPTPVSPEALDQEDLGASPVP